jgi:GT2 family glycosyltransferase
VPPLDLSAVVVSYNSRAHLAQCLGSIRRDPAGAAAEIVVVDNDSRDGSAELIESEFRDARVVRNRDNVGYARAVNQGIAATAGRHVLVLNPDCEVASGALATLSGFLDAHADAGITAPRILNPDGSLEFSARAFPDHLTFFFNRYSLLTRLFPNNPFSRRYLLTDWDHKSARVVDWVSGACMLVRRDAVARVGGMDEAFFMFNEDVDWCRRMKDSGFAVWYVPDATVVHHIGASRTRVAPRVIVERHRGMIHYFHKHHPMNPVLRALADTAIMARAGIMVLANALRLR